ncbi:hypothetical protein N665_0395s0026 [Sinapis alba]|nr:hypothetical protein N665_0395s0026 [Sinapis alba]
MAVKEEGGNDGFLGNLRDLTQLLQEIISQERSNEQGTSNHQLAGLSTTYNVLPFSNAFTESDAIRREQLGESDLASKYNLPDDEEVTNPIDYSSSDYDVVRYQLQEPFSLLSVQRYTSELNPRHSASSLNNQPMPTASSHGRRPPISMTKALTTATDFVPKRNQQAMNNPHYSQSQYQVPSGQYGGNTTNSPYSLPNQNEGYNMPPSAAAFQKLAGSNMAHNAFPYWRPEQNDSYNMPPQSAVSIAPYAYGSVNLFGTSSDNAANSRFGYEGGGVSRNHLPSLQQHQSGDSNVWPPSSRCNRQQRQQQPWSDILASLNQQNDRSDPSDQTQQRLWPTRQLE